MKVALAVSSKTIDGVPDTAILTAALEEAGHVVRLLDWCNDPVWDWPDLTLLHAPWDYTRKAPAFLSWLDRVSAHAVLLNGAGIVNANIHKSYLLDLQRAGIEIPQSSLLRKGSALDLRQLQSCFGSNAVVVKPAIGAGGRRLERLSSVEAMMTSRVVGSAASLREDLLVQRYEETIETLGEFSLVLLDGDLSHLINKKPRRGEYRVQAAHGGADGPIDIDGNACMLAESLSPFVTEALYARIDYVIGADGSPLLMELELTEPDLFLRYSAQAATRLVAGLSRRGAM